MSDGFIGLLKKAKPVTDWLDNLPGIPAAAIGLVVGTIIPVKLLVVGVVIVCLYAAVKFASN